MTLQNKRYIIQGLVGQGGMGAVYRAFDRLTGEQVALKQVVLSSLQSLGTATPPAEILHKLRLALAHEFRTLASLRHPHIISVLDYGFAGEHPYFTMTYLQSAQTLLEAGQGLTVVQKVKLIQEMLAALAYLHRRGILHRDLKPENVLYANGTVRVLDFGLAVAKEDARESVGTWQYVAPEVVLGEPTTEAADLYAVGVLAYQLFANDHPFDIAAPDFVDQILEQPADLSRLGVNEALSAVIGALLAKKPQDRYPGAEAATAAFSAAVGLPIPTESISIRESYLQAAQFVGRDKEMGKLTAALQQAKAGQGAAWLIGGESGVGKSRLLNELQIQALVDGFLVLRGQGVEEGGRPYQLWIDALRRLVLQQDLDPLSASVLQSIVTDLGQLLERKIFDPPALNEHAARQRLFSIIAQLFQQTDEPILLILEDLQWTQESLALLAYVNRQIAGFPVLIIGNYRDDEQPNLPQQLPTMQVMSLPRLNQANMAALSAAMLGEVGQQPEVLQLLQRETEGNAFFLVEVVRTLAEEAGRLSAIGAMPLPAKLFPRGIETIVERRLAGVPEMARALLPGAAVIGRQLDLSLMAYLVQQTDSEMSVEAWLSACADAAVLDVDNGRWQFAHDKLRDGILNHLSADERANWHRQAAEAITVVYPNAPEQAGSLAYHWQIVGDQEQERRYAQIAGDYARSQFLNNEAITYLSRALALTPAADLHRHYSLRHTREQVYHLQGNREAQLQDIDALQSLAEQIVQTQGEDKRAEAALCRANYAEAVADYPAAIDATNIALQLALNAGDRAAGHLALGRTLMRQGKYDEAQAQFTLSLAAAKQNSLPQIEADSFRLLGAAAADLSQFGQAQDHYQKALAIYHRINDRQGESAVLNNLGVAAYSQGDLAAGLNFWKQAARIHDQIGDREGRGRVLTNLSSIYIDLGDYETGHNYSQTALQICREINARFGECFNLINLGLTAHYQRKYEQADNFSLEALAVAREIGSAFLQGLALKDRGHILANEHRLAEARAHFEEAITIWTELEQQSQLLETQAGLAQVALLLGQPDEAAGYIEPVVTYVQTTEMLDGMSRPFHVYLTCYELLLAVGDERAIGMLQQAAVRLQEQAIRITDDKLRHTFLWNVAVHRTIVTAVQQKRVG